MATIIRIQGRDGKGIYQSQDSHSIPDAGSRHPAPHKDSLLVENAPHIFLAEEDFWGDKLFNNKSFIFGFKDYTQMRSWLYNDEWLSEMGKSGMRVFIMEGEVYEGNTQAVINRETAKVIRELSIEEFLAENKEKD